MAAYRFGPFHLDPREQRLLRDGVAVALTPKVFDTLVYLVERRGRLVGKDDLLNAIWGGNFVEESSLSRAIHVLRKALSAGDVSPELRSQYIETVPTKGYRFVAEVTCVDDPPPQMAAESAPLPNQSTPGDLPAAPPPNRYRSTMRAVVLVAGLVVVAVAAAALSFPRWDATPDVRLPVRPATLNGAAYARVQAGRQQLERQWPGDIEAALGQFSLAARLDPNYAAAHAGEADARFFRFWTTGAHEDIVQARLAVREAMARDPDSADAHMLQCRLLATYDWQFAEAETACRRAVALDPRNADARRELAMLFNSLARRDEARREIDLAVTLAPTSINKRTRGSVLYFQRRYDEAIAQWQQIEATDPDFTDVTRWISRAYEQKRDYRHALEYFLRAREAAGARADEVATLRAAFRTGGWNAVLRRSVSVANPATTLESAGTLAQLGEIDAAFRVLDAMVRARRVMAVNIVNDPRLDPLRGDPRYQTVIGHIGLPRSPRVG